MLERAADLILAVIVKVDTGQLPVGDPAPRFPYTDAFLAAIDAFNQTEPPPGALNQGWETVSTVTGQYNLVYAALIQGKAISIRDYNNLRAFRQIMANYQAMAERYLTQSGLGADFFAGQRQAVEEHFKRVYGDRPIPALTQPGGK
jgi:hypothetical protein